MDAEYVGVGRTHVTKEAIELLGDARRRSADRRLAAETVLSEVSSRLGG